MLLILDLGVSFLEERGTKWHFVTINSKVEMASQTWGVSLKKLFIWWGGGLPCQQPSSTFPIRGGGILQVNTTQIFWPAPPPPPKKKKEDISLIPLF